MNTQEEEMFHYYMEREIRALIEIINNSTQAEAEEHLTNIIWICLNMSYSDIGDMDGVWCTLRQYREE